MCFLLLECHDERWGEIEAGNHRVLYIAYSRQLSLGKSVWKVNNQEICRRYPTECGTGPSLIHAGMRKQTQEERMLAADGVGE